jgi:cytohesin
MPGFGWPLARAFNAAVAVLSLTLLVFIGWAVLGDATGWTPLHEAVREGDTAEVFRLFREGADVNAADLFGVTPLHVAVTQGDFDTTFLLLRRGADPNARTRGGAAPKTYRGPHVTVRPSIAGRQGSEQRLVLGGRTPLCDAAAAGNTGITDALIRAGANVNTCSALPLPGPSPERLPLVSPLAAAVDSGNPELVRLLLAAGARPGPNEDISWPFAEPRTMTQGEGGG